MKDVNPYDPTLHSDKDSAGRFSIIRPFQPDIACARWFLGVCVVHVSALAIHACVAADFTLDFEPLWWIAIAGGLYYRVRLVRYAILLAAPLYMIFAMVAPILWWIGVFDASSFRIGSTFYDDIPAWSVVLYCVALFVTFAYPFVVLILYRVAILWGCPIRC